ncbi:hypothetical protein B0H11DRAFT_1677242, partial [Mycena galericulata]
TRTIPQRAVYSAIQADVRSLMAGVQTQEQLDELRARLDQVQRAPEEEAGSDRIQDPPTVHRKGRPLTQRLTGVTEGRPRGGGARIQVPDQSQGPLQRRRNQCSRCHLTGHNRSTCP